MVEKIWQSYAEWYENGVPNWIYWLLGFLILVSILLALHRGRYRQNLKEWLDQHFQNLSKKQQRELTRLRDGYRPSRLPRYGRDWPQISRRVHKERPRCEICGAPSTQVHHKRYRRIRKDKPRDLVALCDMCHYYIHPKSIMTRAAFKKQL